MKITRRRMFTALAAVATAGLGGLGIRSGAARYYDGPVSDHFDGLRFFDPHGSPPNSVAKLFRWYTGSGVSRSSGTRRFGCKRRA